MNTTQISASKVMELREMTGAAMMDCKKALSEAAGDFEKAKDILRTKGQAIVMKKLSREAKEGLLAVQVERGSKGIQKLAVTKLSCETDFVARNDKFGQLQEELTQNLLKIGVAEFQKGLATGENKTKLEKAVAEFGENIQVTDYRYAEAQGQVLAFYLHTNKKVFTLIKGKVTGSNIDAKKTEEIFRDVALHLAANRVEALDASAVPREILTKEEEIFTQQMLEQGKKPEMIAKIVKSKLEKFISEVCLMNQPFLKNPDQTIAEFLAEQGRLLGVTLVVVEFQKIIF